MTHSKNINDLKKEKKKVQKLIQRFNEVMKYPYGELQFLQECTNVLIECQQVLKWACVVRYFMHDLEE